jgi:hypothetical protein
MKEIENKPVTKTKANTIQRDKCEDMRLVTIGTATRTNNMIPKGITIRDEKLNRGPNLILRRRNMSAG